MTQSLSFLKTYEKSEFPWIVANGHLYVGSENVLKTTVFGNTHIGIEDKGLVKQLENQHIASRKHLLRGTLVDKTPTNFEDKVVAAYWRQVSSDEEGPRREWLKQAARNNLGECLLEQTLQKLQHAEVYIGVKGKMYALKEQTNGPFRFRNKQYLAKDIGTTTKVCAQHEQKIQKYLRTNKTSFRVESQELSSLEVSLKDNICVAKLTLEPFAMRTPYGIYAFDHCIAEYAFTVKENAASFTDIPQIIHPKPYTHPFVWFESNNICFDGNERWRKAQVPIGGIIPRNDAEEKIAFVAAETARMMRGTYTKNTHPANNLENMNRQKITEEESIQKGLVVYGKK